MSTRAVALVLALCLGLAAAQDEEGRAVLLLHKKIFPTEGFSVNQPINVTLTVYNKGEHAPPGCRCVEAWPQRLKPPCRASDDRPWSPLRLAPRAPAPGP